MFQQSFTWRGVSGKSTSFKVLISFSRWALGIVSWVGLRFLNHCHNNMFLLASPETLHFTDARCDGCNGLVRRWLRYFDSPRTFLWMMPLTFLRGGCFFCFSSFQRLGNSPRNACLMSSYMGRMAPKQIDFPTCVIPNFVFHQDFGISLLSLFLTASTWAIKRS